MKQILLLTVLACLNLPAIASSANIYKDGWIDLNKNGVKDVYEDPKADIENRIANLISQMTMDEKTCQMVTLYGYKRVLVDELPTPQWKNKLWKDGLGAIDEHLNGFHNWGLPLLDSEYCWPASKHAWALNQVQKFFIEETRLGIPVDFTNEGIRGIESFKATNFPTQLALGCTWDRDLINKVGYITGSEARALGYTNVYAPILDVGYDQRCGRYEEIYGESPYLVAELGIAMAKGLQKDYQVASTAKHFAIYSVNKGAREMFARLDPKTSPREAEAIFLYPFKRVIKEAGILGVMSSYNDYDGEPIESSKYWLTERLRGDFGFKGYVVSDSGAVEYLYNKHRTASSYKEAVYQSVEAGLDVRCTFKTPDSYVLPLRELVSEGRISEQTINERVAAILRVKFTVGAFDRPYVEDLEASDRIVYSKENRAIATDASRKSLVLLKNDNNALPLDAKKIKTIAVCGPNATDTRFASTHYGPLATEVTSVLDGIKNKVGSGVEVLYTKGCDLTDKGWPETEILPEELTETEKAEIQKAVENAKKADVAIVVIGGNVDTCGENKSRSSLELPGKQLDLVKAIQKTGTPVVAVLVAGRPLSINWVDKYVPAVLGAFYPGSEGGIAIADVLFGDYNPGGKLSVSYPKTVGQIPMNFPSKPYADAKGYKRVNGFIYPFGHGLSYTTFEYSDLRVTPEVAEMNKPVNVSFKLKNTGSREGDEIVQLYVRDVLTKLTTYDKNLRGFERVHLLPGQEKTIEFTLTSEDLAYVGKDLKWFTEAGEFLVMIGASSENIKLQKSFELAEKENVAVIRNLINKKNLLASYISTSDMQTAERLPNLLDGDLTTRWTSNTKDPYVEFELVEKAEPDEIQISWYLGDSRKYKFDVKISAGGGQRMTVFSGESSGKTTGLETYKLDKLAGSNLRIVIHGNNQNEWSSLNEVVIPEFKGNSLK